MFGAPTELGSYKCRNANHNANVNECNRMKGLHKTLEVYLFICFQITDGAEHPDNNNKFK